MVRNCVDKIHVRGGWCRLLCLVAAIVAAVSWQPANAQADAKGIIPNMGDHSEVITLGGGCFWCVEAVFQNFRGVEKVESGYAGGKEQNPTYEDVGTGRTGHAEVVQVTFNPSVITTDQILTIFFHAHDPTTKDRQGADFGPQYRSIALYSSDAQKEAITRVMKKITDDKVWGEAPLTTEVAPLKGYYSAEEYHQNYFASNQNKPYCSFVIAPKVQKIRKEFKELLKD